MSTVRATNFQHASAAAPAIVLAADGTAAATVSGINGGPLAGFRNAIINGAMEVAQRGTSFAAVANATYTLDRFLWENTGAMVVTITRSTDTPNNSFNYSLRVDVTTADTSIAAGDFAFVTHRIEGSSLRHLIGQTFVLSFWVKSSKTGTHCVAFRNGVADRSYVATYSVAVANTWEFKSVMVTNGLITTGTWDWTTGYGLGISFVLTAGTNFHTTAGAWQTGNFVATSAQVNATDSTANDLYITGVQLEAGPVATPFECRPVSRDLAMCQRYYNRSTYLHTVNSADNIMFPTEMRATPNVVLAQGAGATVSASAVNVGGFKAAASGAGDFTWTASAEL